VRVQQVQLDFGSGPLSVPAARIGSVLAEQLLDDVAVWRADPEGLRRLQRAGIGAADIIVTPHGLEVRFAEPH
jgi:hypothetical protein